MIHMLLNMSLKNRVHIKHNGTTLLSIFHSGTFKSTTNSDTFDSARQLKSITISTSTGVLTLCGWFLKKISALTEIVLNEVIFENRTIPEESALSEVIDFENRTIPEEFALSEFLWDL